MTLPFQFNLVDILILIVLGYYVWEAWKTELWIVLADFWGFLLALVTSLWWYSFIANFIKSRFPILALLQMR
jgi:cadmium resistance protein CadD (predicted permease)